MLRRVLVGLLALAAAGGSLFVHRSYPDPNLVRLAYTLASLGLLYLLFRVVLDEVLGGRIQGQKSRYVFRKTLSVLYIGLFILIVIRIWVADPQALLVAYGIVGAGVAIALQDIIKNFAGGILLFLTRPYQVGDRIEVDDRQGDVIDIGLLYTRVLEIGGWVDGDQATGRTVSVPNGRVLGTDITNYTQDNTFIWDEITIPVTYESDWELAQEIATAVATEETADVAETAQDELRSIQRRYYLDERETEPQVFIRLTDNWVELHLRYIVPARERRTYTSRISSGLLSRIDDEAEIEVASETISIVDFPGTDPATGTDGKD